ncbi:MAG TPA: dihydrofolate reductase family protein [Acidimicrobiales bacterium]|jgi:dihydrofolate reductase
MGKIVSNFFISLDGVVESPDKWHFPYFNDEMGNAIGKAAETTEAFLMGRVLYEEWAGFWPDSKDEPFASFLNNSPKYVASRTLSEATWNNTTIIGADLAAEIREVKDSIAGDITMSGSATLVRWLLANGLVDQLNLLLHPIAVGKGQRLFEDTPTHPLRLVSEERFSTGVLNLAYVPDDTPTEG